ncbi:hypothetical protein Avbf_10646 [Armadillidium vulgare]|nr:hypothetical protein Avbf_10646 [Armadillidium vulgare]
MQAECGKKSIPYQDLLHYYGTENLFCGNLFDRDFNIVILISPLSLIPFTAGIHKMVLRQQ